MSEIGSLYAGKAQRYAQFRWDYAPAVLERLCTCTGLRPGDSLADLGAGPGTLSRWFVTHGFQVWAVEPEAEMRAVATGQLGHHANYHSIAATAEATGLPAASISLIVVGRALHWFTPELTRREFQRILQPDGWLAVLAVRCTDPELDAAVKALATAANGFNPERSKRSRPAIDMQYYFQPEECEEVRSPAVQQEEWPAFIGRLSTFSGAPTPDTPAFAALERATRKVFDQFAAGDLLTIPVETHLRLGRLRRGDTTEGVSQ